MSAADADAAPADSPRYEPRCILVTGGAGFIGSHVVLRLVQEFPDTKVRSVFHDARPLSLQSSVLLC